MGILKVLTTIIVLCSFFISPTPKIWAQETEEIPVEVSQDLEEDIVIDEEEEETEDEESLPETLKVKEQPRYSLGTILLAILIPSIFVILIYLIFKFFKF